jgi:hypothetical protein
MGGSFGGLDAIQTGRGRLRPAVPASSNGAESQKFKAGVELRDEIQMKERKAKTRRNFARQKLFREVIQVRRFSERVSSRSIHAGKRPVATGKSSNLHHSKTTPL